MWLSWGDGSSIGRVLEADISRDGSKVSVNDSGTPAPVVGLKGASRVVSAHSHTCALFPPRPGDAFEYDDFQNFESDFSFTGDAEPSFSPPLVCPRCASWDSSPQPIGFEPVKGYKCQAPLWGSSSRAWCYIGKYTSSPCKFAQQVQASLLADLGVDKEGKQLIHYRVECEDNGRIHLTPYPPETRKRGCVWLKKATDIYGAFSAVFQFEIKGVEWDKVHTGGDGLALVFQNEGLNALGGNGKNLGAAEGDANGFTLGIQDALALEIRTFDNPGFVVRGCGSGPFMLNDSCVYSNAAFNTLETTATVYQFEKLDVQDGRLHTILIKYAPYQMQVYADNVEEARMRFPLRLQDAVPPSEGHTAYMGFCASTGDAISSLQLTSLRYTALEQEGALYTWGQGTYAQLGLRDRRGRDQPNLVTSLDGIPLAAVSAGKRHSVALGEDGRIYTWGDNKFGQLGHGDTKNRLAPTSVRRLWELLLHTSRLGHTFKPVQVAAGYFHTLVLVERGEEHGPWQQLYGFGDNSFGQLGCINQCSDDLYQPKCKVLCPSTHPQSEIVLTPSELMSFTPSIFKESAILLRVSSMVAGASHSIVLTEKCPTCVSAALAARFRCKETGCKCVLKQEDAGLCVAEEAEVLVWGSNVRGQLGDGLGGQKWGRAEFPVVLTKGPPLYYTHTHIPPNISQGGGGGGGAGGAGSGNKVVQVVTGHSHTLVLLANGSVYGWGANYHGQLGLSDRRLRTHPTAISRFDTRKALHIAAGPYTSAAVVACGGGGEGWMSDSDSCDCQHGFKGYDCAVTCHGSFDYKKNLFLPCSGKGTFDRAFRLGDTGRNSSTPAV